MNSGETDEKAALEPWRVAWANRSHESVHSSVCRNLRTFDQGGADHHFVAEKGRGLVLRTRADDLQALPARVVLDEQRGGDGTERRRDQRHEKHQHPQCALTVIVIGGEVLEDIADGTTEALDRVVRVVHAREAIPAGDTHVAQGALVVGTLPRVDRDRPAGEQHDRDDHHVADVEQELEVARVEDVRRPQDEADDDEVAPGEPGARHQRTHPRHEAAVAAGVLALDPGLADRVRVPPGNPQVEQDEQKNQRKLRHASSSLQGRVQRVAPADINDIISYLRLKATY